LVDKDEANAHEANNTSKCLSEALSEAGRKSLSSSSSVDFVNKKCVPIEVSEVSPSAKRAKH